MKKNKAVLFAAILLCLLSQNIFSQNTIISTTSNDGSTIGMEVVVDQFGHISRTSTGTSPGDQLNQVDWVNYRSLFLKINNWPLGEVKENAATPFGPNAITPYDNIPVSPTGTNDAFFLPNRYDTSSWEFQAGVNEKSWYNVFEFEWNDGNFDNRVHLVGGIGYQILDPSPILGSPYVEFRPAYQITNVGPDTLRFEPFLFERINQFSRGAAYSNNDPGNQAYDYDGIFGTSDDFVLSATDPGITPLPFFSFSGYPLSHYRLDNNVSSIFATLQGSGGNYNLVNQTNPVQNPAEITYQFDTMYIAPGQAGLYWLNYKPLKFWNVADNYPTNIDYDKKFIKQEFGTYDFAGTDVSVFFSYIEFVTNQFNGVAQDSSEATLVEITGGMIESETPANIGRVLDNRYWELFYDTRRTNTVIHPTFNFDAAVDDIQMPDSLTLLYRLNYEEPWTEWLATDLDLVANTLTALSMPFGNIQFVLAERTGNPPAVPVLVSPNNQINDLWYNPNLEWICETPADYNLQVADNPAFNNPIISNMMFRDDIEANYQFFNRDLLQDNTTYYWRVKAINEFGESDFSETWSFTISYLNWELLPEMVNNGIAKNLNAVHFLNQDTGYVAGDGGFIRKTEDGGENWIFQATGGVGQIFNSLDFINEETGIIVGTDASILKLTAPNNWDEINDGFGAPIILNDVEFPSQNIGYAVGRNQNNSVVLKTIDGGETWQQLVLPINGILEASSFISVNSGFIVGRNGIILKTDNGGDNWDIIDDGFPVAYDYYSVQFVSQNTVFVSGNDGVIIRSNNDGLNWTMLETYRSQLPVGLVTYNSLHFIDHMNGFAVASKNGSYQVVLRTTDGGAFWGIQNSNAFDQNGVNDAALDAVHFGSNNVGYAVGYDGTIIKYGVPEDHIQINDAVVGIENVIVQPGNMIEVPLKVALSENVKMSSLEIEIGGFQGLAQFLGVITQGTLTEASNWMYEVNNSTSSLNIAFAGSTEISGNGELFRLQFYVPDDLTVDFIPIYNYGTVINDGSINVNIKDGGIKLEGGITYGDVDNDGSIRALDASFILKYLNGILSETEINAIAADVSLDKTISTIDASLILKYVVSLIDTLPYSETLPNSTGNIELENSFVSSDELITNVPLTIKNGENIYGSHFVFEFDYEKLSFVGIENWNEELSAALKEVSVEDGIIKVSVASSKANLLNGLIANMKFEVKNIASLPVEVNLKQLRINEEETQFDVSTSIINLVTSVENGGIPTEFELSQNYPNPFNPTTSIKFAIPQNDFVSIKVYDILGNEIAVLVNEELNAGFYNINFDASNLVSGLYIYRIQSNNFVDVKKMLLVK